MGSEVGIPFGNYTLLKRIAQGGMAEVFVAQSGMDGLDRLVAIKRILPHLLDDPSFVRMFQDEAHLASRLTHPGIIHIYDFGKVEEHFFIAMEFIDGVHTGDLIHFAETHVIPATFIARIGADACAGLNYAHNSKDEKGQPLKLVHRDVSPPNLLVSRDGLIKLVDFGIAKAVSSIEQTRSGVVKGKYAYMSPEQTMGKPLNGRSDVFSLALVMWELLAGKSAVSQNDQIAAMTAIRDGKIPPIESIRTDIPKKLATALRNALAKEPTKRSDAQTFGADLEEFLISQKSLETNEELGVWIRSHFPKPEITEVSVEVDVPLAEVTGAQDMVFGRPGETGMFSEAPLDTITDDVLEQGHPDRVASGYVSFPDLPGASTQDAPLKPPRSDNSVVVSLTAGLSGLPTLSAEDDSVTVVMENPLSMAEREELFAPSPSAAPVVDELKTMVVLTPLPMHDEPGEYPLEHAQAGSSPAPYPMVERQATSVISAPNNRKLVFGFILFALILAGIYALASSQNQSQPSLRIDDAGVAIPLTITAIVDAGTPVVEVLEFEPAPIRRRRPNKRDGKLTVRTTPNSVVYHRGEQLGTTPIIDLPMRPGRYTLTLKASGRPTVTQKVKIRKRKSTKVNITLPR